jgi:hypothetical protein
MFSSKNFINGRIILQDGIYFRFSFLPHNQCALTIEDLRCPQLEERFGSARNGGRKPCGRIDFSPSETECLFNQWDAIMCQCFETSSPSPSSSLSTTQWDMESSSSSSSVFPLLPPGCTLQRLPYGPLNRTVCGMETVRSIQVEISGNNSELCFVRQQFIETVAKDEEEDGKAEHVQCCAVVSLDINRGMRRLDLIIQQLCQLKRLMFPPTTASTKNTLQ